ncbi:MAG: hypothetical protein LBB73_02195 [Dysgonamonadaceae bacterium]|jgi:hypothetical protein|nr:hypothetical protein [Dysgonamonadaceae bacterium]
MRTRKLKFGFIVIVLSIFAESAAFGQESVLYSAIQKAKEENVEFQRLPSVFVQESTPQDIRLSSKFNNMEEWLFGDVNKVFRVSRNTG